MLKLEVFLQMKELKYKSDIDLGHFKPVPETEDAVWIRPPLITAACAGFAEQSWSSFRQEESHNGPKDMMVKGCLRMLNRLIEQFPWIKSYQLPTITDVSATQWLEQDAIKQQRARPFQDSKVQAESPQMVRVSLGCNNQVKG